MHIKLGMLDHTWITHGQDAAAAFAETVELAQQAEKLGYNRFWVSEHHDTPNIAGSSPEVLISYLLAKTRSIRIGSGGVMLQHYSPFKVAENFNVMASLAPNRVELGIGRATGGLPRATEALKHNSGRVLSVDEKLEQLAHYLMRPAEKDPSVAGLQPIPIPPRPPGLYVLGSSANSGLLAARLGLPYVYALIINDDEETAAQAFALYRSNYEGPAEQRRALLALSVIVGETDEEAELLSQRNTRIKFLFENGQTYTALTKDEAEALSQRFKGRFTIRAQQQTAWHGSKETIRRKLLEAQSRYGADEFLVTTIMDDFNARLRSYELLMSAFPEAAERWAESGRSPRCARPAR